MDSAHPLQNHTAIQHPPQCRNCGNATTWGTCRPDNMNGNANRPRYICSCGLFACFGDMRGVLVENPPCDCNDSMEFSRRIVAGPNVQIPRSIFYRCATGRCDFYSYMKDQDGNIMVYDGPIDPLIMADSGH
ncbi:uncharacterized protein KD926_011527 [Aspergillus affinis]|uniref:uncharacterized protein n=1 Tax=Aspergillus affinis TaxID=1070780 RepID=UPI0022FF0587|nr:uncharacterized protein KD926_011527 [Aspergillus affinis]KAI9037824.1 hypothetical protein KD926_011527 [Aspergillus affinis]